MLRNEFYFTFGVSRIFHNPSGLFHIERKRDISLKAQGFKFIRKNAENIFFVAHRQMQRTAVWRSFFVFSRLFGHSSYFSEFYSFRASVFLRQSAITFYTDIPLRNLPQNPQEECPRDSFQYFPTNRKRAYLPHRQPQRKES